MLTLARFCALVIVSVYSVDVDAVVAAADSDAGADVALAGAVAHIDTGSPAGAGVGMLGPVAPAIAPVATPALLLMKWSKKNG